MRIAVTYENGEVFQHFGHTERFKVYDAENGAVQVASIVNTNGEGHGALAHILKNGQVDVLICGGIGGDAKRALAEAGIQLYAGVRGEADQAVADFLADRLNFDPQAQCDHHGGHSHGEGGHSCGAHRCGGETK